MIYKLIILVASIFMIYEFTKSRSTAVASIEPNIIEQMRMANIEKNRLWNLKYPDGCNNLTTGFDGTIICLDDMPAWLKLNGA